MRNGFFLITGTSKGIGEAFVQHLSEAESNLPEMGKGDRIYQRLVKAKCVTLYKVINTLPSLLYSMKGIVRRKSSPIRWKRSMKPSAAKK
jgi:hypothetical protein